MLQNKQTAEEIQRQYQEQEARRKQLQAEENARYQNELLQTKKLQEEQRRAEEEKYKNMPYTLPSGRVITQEERDRQLAEMRRAYDESQQAKKQREEQERLNKQLEN